MIPKHLVMSYNKLLLIYHILNFCKYAWQIIFKLLSEHKHFILFKANNDLHIHFNPPIQTIVTYESNSIHTFLAWCFTTTLRKMERF